MAYCVDEVAAMVGESRDHQPVLDLPAYREPLANAPHWRNGLLVGTIPVIRDD